MPILVKRRTSTAVSGALLLALSLLVGGCGGSGETVTSPPPSSSGSAASVSPLMPLGDSITDGYNVPGGYRTELYRRLSAQDPGVNFVGSLQNGPATLPDRDHEGHVGWRIDQIAAQVDGWLDRSQPDVVLLMIGTNDMIQDRDPANAPARLGALLDQMFARRPDLRVFVSTLPPLANAEQNRRVAGYNAALPALVAGQAAQGRKLSLVNAGGSLAVADLADGVHPNAAGYAKLGDLWYEALGQTAGTQAP